MISKQATKPNIHLGRLWLAFDMLFVAGLAISLLLGGKVTPLLVVAGVVPIPFLLFTLRERTYHVPRWRLLMPFGVYFTYSLLAFFSFTGLEPEDTYPVNPSLEFYAVALAMVAVGLIRGLQVRNLARLMRHFLPWVLFACFLILTYLMFAEIRVGCRVQGAAPWPFIPALLFATLSLLLLVGWREFSPSERWMRLFLLSVSLVVSTTYTGSRGIALAQLGVIGLLFILGFLPTFRAAVPRWYHIIIAVTGAVIFSLAVGFATGCGPADRFATTVKTVTAFVPAQTSEASSEASSASVDIAAEVIDPMPKENANSQTVDADDSSQLADIAAADQSIGLRLAMWETSWNTIVEKPIFGHGALYLQRLIMPTYGFEHNHNQYLTWLVTGGILQLCLGLLFLATPWFISFGLNFPDRLFLTFSVSVLWGAALMFDSYFNLKFYTHYYCLLCGVLYAWVNDICSKEEHSV